MLLTLNNSGFLVAVQRSYVQFRDRSTVPVQHGPRVGKVDWSNPLFFVYCLVISMGQRKPTYTDEFYYMMYLQMGNGEIKPFLNRNLILTFKKIGKTK